MREAPPVRRRRWSVAAFVLCAACALPSRPAVKPCSPACARQADCAGLDERLLQARAPLLGCVGRATRHGHLDRAHRCYRALRLIESARWWLRTLNAEDASLPAVYGVPVETVRLDFLCRLRRLAGARTPEEVERRYLDMIRAYP